MTITITLISLLTTTLFLIATSQQPPPPPPPPPSGCSDELVSLSPCLGYISMPPNNITENVTSQCCEAFFESGGGNDSTCICYLLRQPLIFGFPLNESRVLTLSSVCSLKNDSFLARNGSLKSFCSVSPVLPPLHSTTGSGTSKPTDSGPKNASTPSRSSAPGSVRSSPTSLKSPPDSAMGSARPPTSSAEPARGSPATKLDCKSTSWFLPGALVLLIFFHM